MSRNTGVESIHPDLLLSARDGDSKANRDLEFLNVSIRARIEDFDNFYDNHYQDFRMPFFEKQKFRLRRLLAESMITDPNFDETYVIVNDSKELEIVSDDMLEAGRKGATGDTSAISALNKTGMAATKMSASKSPLRTTNESRERRQQMLNESSKRLSSPPKKPMATFNDKDEDLIFSIKMSKEEYAQYLKTKEAANPHNTSFRAQPSNPPALPIPTHTQPAVAATQPLSSTNRSTTPSALKKDTVVGSTRKQSPRIVTKNRESSRSVKKATATKDTAKSTTKASTSVKKKSVTPTKRK